VTETFGAGSVSGALLGSPATTVDAVLIAAMEEEIAPLERRAEHLAHRRNVGAARAVQQLKLTTVELQMAPVRSAVHVLGADFMSVAKGEQTLDSIDYLNDALAALLDDLEWWTFALRDARQVTEAAQKVA